jgi:tetratricopeptide (TPR) repeat protein
MRTATGLRLQTSLYPAYYHRGRALLLQKRYDEALAAFEQMRLSLPSTTAPLRFDTQRSAVSADAEQVSEVTAPCHSTENVWTATARSILKKLRKYQDILDTGH